MASLFGSLLVLMLLVTVTALVLAGALTRPLRRLRKGLEAVGKGEFARRLPTDTRDEIGELAETFNEMRDQLARAAASSPGTALGGPIVFGLWAALAA